LNHQAVGRISAFEVLSAPAGVKHVGVDFATTRRQEGGEVLTYLGDALQDCGSTSIKVGATREGHQSLEEY
jgi:hypothetical protein